MVGDIGTLIDGEPIINLPPKTIEMKKVDFSQEERDFYCRLEAESRAQFAVCFLLFQLDFIIIFHCSSGLRVLSPSLFILLKYIYLDRNTQQQEL